MGFPPTEAGAPIQGWDMVMIGGEGEGRKKEDDRQGAEWEHVKLPGGRCDSPQATK